MAAPRFFSPQHLPRPLVNGTNVEVGEDIARHLQVLRMNAGDHIALFDGQGGEFPAEIIELGKRRATVSLLSFDDIERESTLSITLVQALATSDKMDLIVQKAVELGVAMVQPVASERATLKLSGDRAEKRATHWQSIARSACEQCGRNRVPVVAEPMALEEWLALPKDGVRLMLHPDASKSLIEAVGEQTRVSLLIGPEGGFSERELALAMKHGVDAVRFGPRVLRTETAGLAAVAALNAIAGDLR
ncbi:MAG: 16S rRNA (uracil(1498)-N(3))-methyltransferase [Betaproteobacteria bacterium]|nr:16S rRNA (uracil(1498)-N(3))-methyltransferase [Betaproteobacteria bacterium]